MGQVVADAVSTARERARPALSPLTDPSRRALLLPFGVLAVVAVAVAAEAVGRLAPVVGAPVAAILLGVLVRTRWSPAAATEAGLSFVSKYFLQAAIVLLGATLSLRHVASVGRSSLPVMLGTLLAVLVAAAVAGRALGVDGRLRTLIGVGTGICGVSAIAAVSGVAGATGAQVAYAVATIVVFNIAAVLVFPPFGELLGLSQEQFGLWAGTAVNDTSSVVAAAYAYGDAAGAHAVIVKLTRTTLIVPIVLVLVVAAIRSGHSTAGRPTLRRLVPWFLLWFVAASGANAAGLVDAELARVLAESAAILIVVALAAVGLSCRLGDIRKTGWAPLALGGVLWVVVSASGLLLLKITGT